MDAHMGAQTHLLRAVIGNLLNGSCAAFDRLSFLTGD
jgi:hypothetical protein